MRLVALAPVAIRELAAGASVDVDGVRLEWRDDDRRVLHYRLNALAADAGSAPYLLHVLLDGDRLVGRIGCHEGPKDGVVEIGYDVAPAFRGRGVGKLLMEECVRGLRAAGLHRAIILVARDNSLGREFWLRNAWEELDALPMARHL